MISTITQSHQPNIQITKPNYINKIQIMARHGDIVKIDNNNFQIGNTNTLCFENIHCQKIQIVKYKNMDNLLIEYAICYPNL